MNCMIFIGNLNFETTEETLYNYLEQFGKIESVEICFDKFTFRSKGFAKVKLNETTSVKRFIELSNNQLLDGRPLRVEKFK